MGIPRSIEQAVTFPCADGRLVGVIHAPENARTGMVMVSGGDQYRVGSHRVFVELARALAGAGVAVMRFDHRGIGDTGGDYHGFEYLHEDIRAAIAELKRACPALERIVIGGLCDGASAALIAAEKLSGVDELVLINPWVHTSDLEARTRLINYYASRLKSRDFWGKFFRGQIKISESWRSLTGYLKMFLRSAFSWGSSNTDPQSYVRRMLSGARGFDGPLYIVLSGQDLVAQQFQQLATIDRSWKALMEKPGVRVAKIPGADHTFSVSKERRAFEQIMLAWFGQEAK